MKIDTSRIDGYQNMTVEEKLAALEGFELEAPPPDDKEIQRLKDALSKSNSEAADYKRQLRAKMTDDEAKAAEEARRAALEEREKAFYANVEKQTKLLEQIAASAAKN